MLPFGESAIVDLAKLVDYCLNPSHPRGRHKARVFASVLGIAANDADFLRTELLLAARTLPAERLQGDEFGERFRIDFEIRQNERFATSRSG